MNLINIKGNTYYAKGGTNTGIYLFENKTALMIDPGLSGMRPKRIINELEKNDIKLEYIINTHEHNDHYGSCNQFTIEDKNIKILSSKYAKMYIEDPTLFSKYIVGGKSNNIFDKFFELPSKHSNLEPIKIDKALDEGIVVLNNEVFEIIEFKGHTPGSIGIMTKDKVLFVGDLLVSKEMLSKYDFLFIFDIGDYLNSLKKLKTIEFGYIVLGHGKNIISKNESYELIHLHEKSIEKYLNQIRVELEEPLSAEKILKKIILKNKLSCNYKEFYFYKSSLMSVISYLCDLGEIQYIIKDGELLYYIQKNQIMIK
ncbi:MAG: MBL fold metallo-hydrolase [Peptostreptococcaceae bacterium]